MQFSASDIGSGDTTVSLVTDKGTKIESDAQLVATGIHVNSGLAGTLNSELIESGTGLVKVRPTLQLDHEGYEHIFGLGDVTSVKETKMALRAGLQADVEYNCIDQRKEISRVQTRAASNAPYSW